jgi:adenosylmethionine-8-amino-7-oxononanoate aminotransferase
MNSTPHAHWHGFTQMADFKPLVIESAEGCWLTTTDGRRLFDGVSSLWCNVHGHRHPKIDAAVADQLKRVAHITTLGMSADVTDHLAEKLAEITPGDLSHVFFSSDGSSSVEAAMKMAFQYWQQKSNPCPAKTKFLALGSAYHGDTTGSVSLGGIKYFHQLFAPILFEPVRGPVPCSYRSPESVSAEDAADHYAAEIESLLQQHHGSIAAIVMEPLVQGAAGMITHPMGLLGKIRELCNRYEVLLICDEVAVGFGRTGKLFACEHESVVPDILCMGKGLTAGYLPMAATVARPHVYEAFLADIAASKQFFHGHTFGGNPLAAAAALASIDLFETTDVLQQVEPRAEHFRRKLSSLADHPNVGDIRGRGLMVGIEIVEDKLHRRPFPSAELIGKRICEAALDRGAWIRPLTDVIVAMPPLCSTEAELDFLAETIIRSVQQVVPSEICSGTLANQS